MIDDFGVSFGGCMALDRDVEMIVADLDFSIAPPPKLVRAMLATLT